MRALTRAAVSFAGLLMALALTLPAAAAPLPAPMRVDAFIRDASGATEVVATVTATARLDEIQVELRRPGRLVASSGVAFTLEPGNSHVVRFSVKEKNGLFLVAKARAAGGRTELGLALNEASGTPGKGDSSGTFSATMTALLGLVGVVTGAALTHFSGVRRDRSRAGFEARLHVSSRDTPAYREFLASWRKSTAPSHLEKAFDELKVKVALPTSLTDVYAQTLRTLRDHGRSVDEKRAAAEALHAAVESAIAADQ